MDLAIFYFFYNLTNAHSWLGGVALFFSNYAIYILPFVIALYVVLILKRPVITLLYSAGVVSMAMLFTEILKQLFSVPRPFVTLGLIPVDHVTNFSFPSVHAAFAGALFVAVYFLVSKRNWFVVVVGISCVAIALSRVMLGVHYPFDIFVGCILGMVFAYASYKLLGDTI